MTLDIPRTRPEPVRAAAQRAPMTLRDRYTDAEGRVQLTGVQALVRLPLDQRRADAAAGLRTGGYVSGYEGSPLAGYDLELLRNRDLLEAHGVVVAPGLNEELALTAVQGTQLAPATGALRDDVADGITGYWYGKAPGLDRATDALRHANLAGTSTHGGALAIVGDDPAAKSSSVPCASEAALADMAVPVLYPADVQDVLDLGRHAVHLSRISGCWVGLKMVTAVADGSGTAMVAPDRVVPLVPDLEIDGRALPPRTPREAARPAPGAAGARPAPRPPRPRPPLRRRQRPGHDRRSRTGPRRDRRRRQELARPAAGADDARAHRRRARRPRRPAAARRDALAARARRRGPLRRGTRRDRRRRGEARVPRDPDQGAALRPPGRARRARQDRSRRGTAVRRPRRPRPRRRRDRAGPPAARAARRGVPERGRVGRASSRRPHAHRPADRGGEPHAVLLLGLPAQHLDDVGARGLAGRGGHRLPHHGHAHARGPGRRTSPG